MWVLTHLSALQSFLHRNTQFAICNSTIYSKRQSDPSKSLNQTQMLNTTYNLGRPNFTIEDAQLEERQSLTALKQFVTHCCEVLGLWRILCEHQFHELVATLSEAHQQMLQNTSFKDLLLFGYDICSLMIAALINTYLGDNASVDSISAKLRNICPSLYKSEDAAYSKVRIVFNMLYKHKMVIYKVTICAVLIGTVTFLNMSHCPLETCRNAKMSPFAFI